jgi:hypothetical protein
VQRSRPAKSGRHSPDAAKDKGYSRYPGELGQILEPSVPYDFIESDEMIAHTLTDMKPAAQRRTLETIPRGLYGTSFALDSLEHNDSVPELVGALIAGLKADGRLIVSGPTENGLYRFGRRVAGFKGHYHHTNIHDIEQVIAARMINRARLTVPAGLPLLSVSTWSLRPS